MELKYTTSKDGAKIAYSISGNGPALVLAHGMGAKKEIWQEYGWIKILEDKFTTICVDIRGNGESDKSYEPEYYSLQNILSDIKAVVNECGFSEYNYFGHSYGATIGLQLWKHDRNIRKVICGGTTFGDEFFKQVVPEWIIEYKELSYKKANNDLEDLSEDDRDWIKKTDINLILAQLKAWNSWTRVDPNEGKTALGIYSGSEDNPRVLENLHQNEEEIKANNIKFNIFNGLDHKELVRNVEIVSPWVLGFLQEKI